MSYQEVHGVEVLAQMTSLYRSAHKENLHTESASFTAMMRSPWNISSPVLPMRTLAFDAPESAFTTFVQTHS